MGSVYGEANANSANVVFPFAQALPAARGLWQMAEEVHGKRSTMSSSATAVVVDWKGPQRTTFDAKSSNYATSSVNVESSLRSLADSIAAAWAAARGQQDRINKARYVQKDIDDDSLIENVGEFFGGETDYGPPPENPATPSAPGYAPTRDPMYPEFGP